MDGRWRNATNFARAPLTVWEMGWVLISAKLDDPDSMFVPWYLVLHPKTAFIVDLLPLAIFSEGSNGLLQFDLGSPGFGRVLIDEAVPPGYVFFTTKMPFPPTLLDDLRYANACVYNFDMDWRLYQEDSRDRTRPLRFDDGHAIAYRGSGAEHERGDSTPALAS